MSFFPLYLALKSGTEQAPFFFFFYFFCHFLLYSIISLLQHHPSLCLSVSLYSSIPLSLFLYPILLYTTLSLSLSLSFSLHTNHHLLYYYSTLGTAFFHIHISNLCFYSLSLSLSLNPNSNPTFCLHNTFLFFPSTQDLIQINPHYHSHSSFN